MKKVYQALYKQCIPGQLPGLWASYATEPCCRKCPDNLTPLFTSLKAQFSEKMLVQSGVAETASDGTVQPSRKLVPGDWLIFLQARDIVDVLTPFGCFSGGLPAVAIWRDKFTQQAVKRWEKSRQQKIVLATDSLDGAVILRALGLAATTTEGLDNPGPDTLRKLCKCYGWGLEKVSTHEGVSGPVEADIGLILCKCSLARLEVAESTTIQAVSGTFQALYHKGLRRIDLGMWAPDAAHLEHLRFQLESFGEKVSAEQLLSDLDRRLFDAAVKPAQSVKPESQPPANLLEAAEALYRAERLARSDQRAQEQVAHARNAFDEYLERDLLRSLQRPGSETVPAHLHVMMHELSRLIHRLTRQAGAMVQGASPQSPRMEELSKVVNFISQLASRVLTTSKEIRACERGDDHRRDWYRSARWPNSN